MPTSQLNKLKQGIKNRTEIVLDLSSIVFGDSNDKTNSAHKFRKAFGNNLSAKIKLSKTELSKLVQSESLFAFNKKCT